MLMFIRQFKKQRSKTAKVFYQYSLVQASRHNGKTKQTNLLYLGSDTLLANKTNRKIVTSLLKQMIFAPPYQGDLIESDPDPALLILAEKYYEKYCIKYGTDLQTTSIQQPSLPPDRTAKNYENVDVDSVQTDQVQCFGAEYLCAQTLDKLQLTSLLNELGWSKADQQMSLIAIASRAIFAASEYMTSHYLKDTSALIKCLGQIHKTISHKQLYRIADKLFVEKNKIDKFLYNQICDLFNLEDKLVIFDLSNTYFESRKDHSSLAQYGRSKEKRSDCKLVVFSGVINAQGFIRHSRIYEGNKPDSGTISDMLDDLQLNSSQGIKKTVVIDAGIATEENLEAIHSKGYQYVCVARTKPKNYVLGDIENTTTVLTNRGTERVRLKILKKQLDQRDTWMYVKSQAKRVKEQSMDNKLSNLFVQNLEQIESSLHKKRGIKSLDKVWERIGRAKEKYPSIAKYYKIEVTQESQPESDSAKITGKKVKPKANQMTWQRVEDEPDHGIYFIRTNAASPTENQVWDTYNTIREVESTFRCLKSQLRIRPVHHQLDHRVESHIYLTILAYQLVNTIRYQLKSQQINYDWNNILRIMNTHTLQRTSLKTPTKTIRISKPAKPITDVMEIYKACHCEQFETIIDKEVVYH